MDEAPDPIVIPGWIWVFVAMFVIGVVAALIIKRDRRGGRSRRSSRHGSSRRHRSSSSRSSGSSDHSERPRRREDKPFDKH